jgi:hypothetical protein
MKPSLLVLAALALIALGPLASATPICDPDTGYCVDPPSPGSVVQPVLDLVHGVLGNPIVTDPCHAIFGPQGCHVPTPSPIPPKCWRNSNGQIECQAITWR